MVKITNNQTVSVKVIQKGKLSETTLLPGEQVDQHPDAEEIITEDA